MVFSLYDVRFCDITQTLLNGFDKLFLQLFLIKWQTYRPSSILKLFWCFVSINYGHSRCCSQTLILIRDFSERVVRYTDVNIRSINTSTSSHDEALCLFQWQLIQLKKDCSLKLRNSLLLQELMLLEWVKHW